MTLSFESSLRAHAATHCKSEFIPEIEESLESDFYFNALFSSGS